MPVAHKAHIQQYDPPPGWRMVKEGIYAPPDYVQSGWELMPPSITSSAVAKREYARCKQKDSGLAYFAFNYCWTVDEDDPTGIAVRKIPAYGYLRRFYAEMANPANTLIDKSRQMLMSWSMSVVVLHDILFNARWSDLIISKRAKDVDDGGSESTPDSAFGKIRFIHQHLPEFLWLPFVYKKFMIRNPLLESHVKGETGKGSAASRGPTYKRGFMDEAAYIERSESVFKGVRQAAKTGTVMISTPNGKANTFARIRFSATTTFKKLSFHWTEHPRKSAGLYCVCGWKAVKGGGIPIEQFRAHDCPRRKMDPPKPPIVRSPWYDEQARDMKDEDVASELDISYERSQRGRVYFTFDQVRHVIGVFDRLGPRDVGETEDEYRWRYLSMMLDPALPLVVCWDFGVSDPTVMLLAQIVSEDPLVVRFVDEVEEAGKSYDFFSNIVNTFWLPAWRHVTRNDNAAILHYGDPAGKQRDSRLSSWTRNLALEGVVLHTVGMGDPLEWIEFIRDKYQRDQIEISEWCTGLIDATANYHFPLDNNGDPVPGDHMPVHDEWSHKMDAKRYLFRNRYPALLKNRKRRGPTARRILARGKGNYDPGSESRIF